MTHYPDNADLDSSLNRNMQVGQISVLEKVGLAKQAVDDCLIVSRNKISKAGAGRHTTYRRL
jgi:hypothetical protein